MSSHRGIKTGIAAVVGTALLAVTPTITVAESPASWDICLAIDTEPTCQIVTHTGSNGPGRRPARAQPSASRTATDVQAVLSCTSRPILQLAACAE